MYIIKTSKHTTSFPYVIRYLKQIFTPGILKVPYSPTITFGFLTVLLVGKTVKRNVISLKLKIRLTLSSIKFVENKNC